MEIRAAHAASGKRYGSPRILEDLKADGRQVGRKRVARLMREEGIEGQAPCRRWNILDLGRVEVVARVTLNGKTLKYPPPATGMVALPMDNVEGGTSTSSA